MLQVEERVKGIMMPGKNVRLSSRTRGEVDALIGRINNECEQRGDGSYSKGDWLQDAIKKAAGNLEFINWREIGGMPEDYFVTEQDFKDANTTKDESESSSYLMSKNAVAVLNEQIIPNISKQYPDVKTVYTNFAIFLVMRYFALNSEYFVSPMAEAEESTDEE